MFAFSNYHLGTKKRLLKETSSRRDLGSGLLSRHTGSLPCTATSLESGLHPLCLQAPFVKWGQDSGGSQDALCDKS